MPKVREWGARALPPSMPLERGTRAWLAGIVAVGAFLRVLWAVHAQQPHGLHDPALYLLLGDQLALGHGYAYPPPGGGVTAYYPPGYPLFLGAAIWLARLALPGDVSAFDVAVWSNVVLSLALVVLVFSLGRRLARSDAVGLVAAGVVALWPNLVFHSAIALSETLFLVVLTAMFLVALATPEVTRHPGWRRVVTVGALFGVAILIRPVSLVIAPLFLVLWWGDGPKRAVQRTAAVAGAVVLVVLPWSIRSTIRMESPVVLSLNFGDNLCIGNSPEATGAYVFSLEGYCFRGLTARERPEFETRRQSEALERAWRYMREHPGDVAGLVPARLRFTLRDDHDGLFVASDWGASPLFAPGTMATLEDLADGFYYGVLALAAAGVVVVAARRRRLDRSAWLFFLLTAPVQLISPAVTFGDPRFKMPAYPVLAVTAAVAVVAAWDRAATRGRRPPNGPRGRRRGAEAPPTAAPPADLGGERRVAGALGEGRR